MSVVLTVQFSRAAIDMNIRIAPFSTVGLSFGILRSFSSKPRTTNLALVCPPLSVMTNLVDSVFCPLLATSS